MLEIIMPIEDLISYAVLVATILILLMINIKDDKE